MKRLSLGLALCALVAACAFAAPGAGSAAPGSATADPVFKHPLDAASRRALDDSFGRLSEKPVVSGGFTQKKRIQRLGRDLVSKGEFIFSAKDGVYWKIVSPYPSTLVLTAKKLVQRSDSGEESVIDANDNVVFKRIASTMQAVFSGDLAALEGEFSVYFQGDPSSWRLGLVPKERTVRDIVASLVVEGGSSIESLRLAEGSGDVVTYTFATVRAAGELTEGERGLFVF